MVDNVTLNAGTGGDVVATEDISGVEYQKVKLVDGTAASTTAIPLSGDLTNGLDVDVTRVSGTVTVDGSAVTQPTNWAGTSPPIGAGVEATALRVTVATDSTGVLTVDGTVTANLSTTDNTVLDNIATSVASIDTNLGGTHVDDAAFTAGTSDGVPVFAMFDDTTPDSVDEGDAGIVRMSANRNMYSTIRDAAGNERGVNVDASNNLNVIESNISGVIGTDGSAGPASVLSVGGTEAGGNIQEITVDSDGHLQVDVLSGASGGTASAVDSNNSSTATLGISAAFTGTGTDVTSYSSVSVIVHSDVASATDGLSMEWSSDNTNWDLSTQHTIAAGSGESFVIPRVAQFFRVVYTNGGTGQTTFRLETILNNFGVSGEIEELDVALDDKDMALTTRAVLAANNGSGYVNIDSTVAGNLKVALEENDAGNLTTNTVQIGGTAVSTGNGATDTGTQRVTLSSDSTGVLSIDDNGGSITIDGTVTANAGTGTQAVSLASVPSHDVTNAGTFATQVDGSALTALQLIDNPIVAHSAASSGATGVSMIGLNGLSSDQTAVTTADATHAVGSLLGKQVVLPHALPGESWSYASTAAVTDTADDAAQAAGGAGVRHYITGIQVFNGSDTVGTEVVIKDGTNVIWRGWAEQTGGGCSATFPVPLRGTANTAVNVANITTSSSTYFNVQGYTAAE